MFACESNYACMESLIDYSVVICDEILAAIVKL